MHFPTPYLAHSLVLSVEDEVSLDLLEIKVVGDLGEEKHIHQVSASHDKLRDQIDIVISVLSKSGEILLSRLTSLILLEKVLFRKPYRLRNTVRFREAQSPP